MRRIGYNIRPKVFIGFNKNRVNEDNYDPVNHTRDTQVHLLHSFLKKQYHFDNYLHQQAIWQYTKQSAELNTTLHRGKKLGKEHDIIAKHLDDVCKKHKVSKGGLITYSGIKWNPYDHAHKRTHDNHIEVHQKNFVSSSIHPHVASGFSFPDDNGIEHVLKIHIPEQAHGAYVAHHSKSKHEFEFLLPRNSKFHIHPKPTYHQDEYGSKIYTWKAHLVHDGTKELPRAGP